MTAERRTTGEGSAQRESVSAGPSAFYANTAALINATAAVAPMRERLRPLVGDLVETAIYWRVFEMLHSKVQESCRDTLAPWGSR
jgi:hypothetical protein